MATLPSGTGGIKSIGTRIALIFGFSTFTVLAVLAFVIAQRSFSNAESSAAAYSLEIVKARADELSAKLARYTRFAQDMAIQETVLRGKREEISAIMPRLDAVLDEEFDGTFIAWSNGDYVTMKGQTGSVADRQYFIDIMSGRTDALVANPVLSKATGKAIVVVAVAIKRNGKTDGLLGIQVTLEALSQTATTVRLGKTGTGFIVDGTGLVIAHVNPDFVMKLDTLKSGELGFKNLDAAGRLMIQGRQSA